MISITSVECRGAYKEDQLTVPVYASVSPFNDRRRVVGCIYLIKSRQPELGSSNISEFAFTCGASDPKEKRLPCFHREPEG